MLICSGNPDHERLGLLNTRLETAEDLSWYILWGADCWTAVHRLWSYYRVVLSKNTFTLGQEELGLKPPTSQFTNNRFTVLECVSMHNGDNHLQFPNLKYTVNKVTASHSSGWKLLGALSLRTRWLLVLVFLDSSALTLHGSEKAKKIKFKLDQGLKEVDLPERSSATWYW